MYRPENRWEFGLKNRCEVSIKIDGRLGLKRMGGWLRNRREVGIKNRWEVLTQII